MADKDNEPTSYASPVCFMGEIDAEMDPAYFGYLSRTEQLALLNLLLECERAGARGVSDIAERCTDAPVREALRAIAHDEARYCAMLTYHIKQLGGVPSHETGSFYRKLVALDTLDSQLSLLDRGQGWVADKLRETLPKLPAGTLQTDLADMLDVHDRNIAHARDLARDLRP